MESPQRPRRRTVNQRAKSAGEALRSLQEEGACAACEASTLGQSPPLPAGRGSALVRESRTSASSGSSGGFGNEDVSLCNIRAAVLVTTWICKHRKQAAASVQVTKSLTENPHGIECFQCL